MGLVRLPGLSPAAAGIIVSLVLLCGSVQAQTVVVRNANQLIDAINASADVIEVQGTITFDSPYQDTGSALPVIDSGDLVIRGGPGAALVAGVPGFRLIEATGDADVTIANMEIRGFASPGNGGAIRLEQSGIVNVENTVFIDNRAEGHGGAIYAQGEGPPFNFHPAFLIAYSRFEDNFAGGQGGAVYARETASSVIFDNNLFVGNEASAGCAVTLHKATDSAVFDSNAFLGPCPHALMRLVSEGRGPYMTHNTWEAEGGKAYTLKLPQGETFDGLELFGNLIARIGESPKPLCDLPDVAGNDAHATLPALGFNIATDSTCKLDEGSDLTGVDAALILDESVLPTRVPEGPAVDAIKAVTIPAFSFSCDAADVNGLGRPQDGDGDGVFGCDIGAVEKQGGADIGPAQTGIYFDPARNGEGYFVEMLGDDLAWVTFFTYGARRPIWFFGLGKVVGNSIVVRGFKTASGPSFGEDFEPAAFESVPVADLSLVFSNCKSTQEPGRAFFDTTRFASLIDFTTPPPGELAGLLSRTVRLSSIVGCDGEPTNTKSGLSGTFYAPERNGEGIVVQWLDEDRVQAAWYTFDLEGGQLWMISGNATVEGNTVTLDMFYPAKSTSFGAGFDPEEIELAPWGTLTLKYTDCNTIEFSYDSVVEGYGSGQYTYTRLTQPAGTQCTL